MKSLKIVCCVLLLFVCFFASAEKKPQVKPVYIFGVSVSFPDSTAYVTDVMRVDSAYVTSKGFLVDRPLYSLQLEGFMSEQRGVAQTTNTVYFSPKEKKIKKKYDRLKRFFLKRGDLKIVMLDKDAFRFKAEEYVEPFFEEETSIEAVNDKEPAKESGKRPPMGGDMRPPMGGAPGGAPMGGFGH